MYAHGGGIENAVGDSGIQVSENSPRAWARQLKAVWESPDILETYRIRGLENADKHRLENIMPRFFEVSRELVRTYKPNSR
jgi:hypothetical protein